MMITKKMNDWLIEHFGEFVYGRENENYQFLLQDFSDKTISKVIADHNVTDWIQLRNILIESTDNEEAIAHLYGDRNAAERWLSINTIKAMQAKMHD